MRHGAGGGGVWALMTRRRLFQRAAEKKSSSLEFSEPGDFGGVRASMPAFAFGDELTVDGFDWCSVVDGVGVRGGQVGLLRRGGAELPGAGVV